MMLELLLPLIDRPDFDSMFGEPLENERSFVFDSAKSVEHEYKQHIKFML